MAVTPFGAVALDTGVVFALTEGGVVSAITPLASTYLLGPALSLEVEICLGCGNESCTCSDVPLVGGVRSVFDQVE